MNNNLKVTRCKNPICGHDWKEHDGGTSTYCSDANKDNFCRVINCLCKKFEGEEISWEDVQNHLKKSEKDKESKKIIVTSISGKDLTKDKKYLDRLKNKGCYKEKVMNWKGLIGHFEGERNHWKLCPKCSPPLCENNSPLSVADALKSNHKPKIDKDKDPEEMNSSQTLFKHTSGSDNLSDKIWEVNDTIQFIETKDIKKSIQDCQKEIKELNDGLISGLGLSSGQRGTIKEQLDRLYIYFKHINKSFNKNFGGKFVWNL